MSKRKLKKINKTYLIIAVLVIAIVLVFGFLFKNSSSSKTESVNTDAKTYSSGRCTAFYPNSENGLEVAKQVCKAYEGKEKVYYDYSLIPYGDYYLVSYGNGFEYYVDKNYESISITEVSEKGKKIIADYLRYTIKKEENDKYYDSQFLKTTMVDEINFDNVEYTINESNLDCYLPDFELTVSVPLKYIQEEIDMNFGYENELYQKPIYIDDEHPVICITFGDGPEFWYPSGETSTEIIVDTLYEYDANATFFLIGDNLEERDNWSNYQVYSFFMNSIANGNEYGSNTQHANDYLTDYSTAEEIKNAIEGPKNTFYEITGYTMQLYRPIAGAFNDNITATTDMTAILWDIDSEDWYSGDGDVIYNKIMKYTDGDEDNGEFETGDIIICSDIYDSTAEAMEKVIPELIDKGYQLVTVSDMMNYIGVDPTTIKYFYSPIYYE